MPTNTDNSASSSSGPRVATRALHVVGTNLAQFVLLGAPGSRRFKKEILPVGHFVHPVTRQEYDFDKAFLDRLAAATNRWIALGHKVWFPAGADCHYDDANDARQNLGFWSAFRVEDESLVADVEVLDTAAAEKIGRTIQDVSAAIQWGALSSTGEVFDVVIVHVAATPCPVIPNQQNFVPLAREGRVDANEKPAEEAADEKRNKDDDSTELADEPSSSPEQVLAKARELMGLPEDADSAAFLKALSEALADDEEEAADGGVPPAALSLRVKELEDRLADQERESAEREIFLAREASVRAGVPLAKDTVEDARALFLAGQKDIARRMLKLAATSGPTAPAAKAKDKTLTSQPSPGARVDDEKAVERDRVLEKAYLSQGLQVEKDARGRITKVSRPPRAER